MRRFGESPTLRACMAALLLLGVSMVGGVRGASPAAALDVTAVMPVVGLTAGPDADHPVIGYTLLSYDGQETCELATIDWMSGLVTDLASTPTTEACVTDLAVAPDGTIYGIKAFELFGAGGPSCVASLCTTPLARLVTFAPDGTASDIEIAAPAEYPFTTESLNGFRGIAVDDDGVVHVIVNGLWVDITDCSPGPVDGSVTGTSPADGRYDWTACLFTVDPTTGVMTPIGPSRWPGNYLAGFSIGDEEAWTLMFAVSPLDATPSDGPAIYWSSVDLDTGEVTPIGSTYSPENGLFDQLRSGATIFALITDPVTEEYVTGIVDPLTGVRTPIAPLVAELPPKPEPEPVTPAFTG